MNHYKKTLVFALAMLALAGCSSQQIGQAIYDSVKTTECSKTTGDPYCNASANPNEH